jgi:hypothetical protein
MEKLAQLLFVLGLVVWIGWVLTRRFLRPVFKTNEQASFDAALKWHIRSMRQDLSMLAVTNFAVLLVLVFALVLKL